MSIDLGDSPVGTPPNSTQVQQMREILGFGEYIEVADAAARKNAGSYDSLYIGQYVIQTNEIVNDLPTIVWRYIGGDVALDTSWCGILATDADGNFSANLVLADGFSLVTPNNSISRIGSRLVYGDGSQIGGSGTSGFYSSATIEVRATGTPAQNGAAFDAAYQAAKLLTPNGNALSSTNRASILVHPGIYNVAPSSNYPLDASYVDIFAVGSIGTSPTVTLECSTGFTFSTTDATMCGIRFSPLVEADAALFEAALGGIVFSCCELSVLGGFGYHITGTFEYCTFPFDGISGTASSFGGVVRNCNFSGNEYNMDTNITGGLIEYCNFAGAVGSGGFSGGVIAWCRTSNSFPTPTGTAKIRMCLDNTFTEVNAG